MTLRKCVEKCGGKIVFEDCIDEKFKIEHHVASRQK
jgi:hypothetical protein